MKVSIVVPVYNGEKTLSSCLDSLMELDFPKENREVIVVDNNSTDGTKNIIKRYPVKYIFESKIGRGAARNKGVRKSRGELVAFIDADCIADRKWLTNLIKGFTSNVVGGCGGEGFSFNPCTLIEKYYNFKYLGSQKRSLTTKELFLPQIATFNAAYRRNVLEDVGLFDDSFIANEDIDLSWRVFLKGYQLHYVPESIVYHKHPDRLTDFLKHWFEYGYCVSYLAQKYAGLIKKPIVSYDDWNKFFFQQVQSTKSFFTTLLMGKDIARKVFPIFDIMKDAIFFLGRIYGLARLRLGIEKIPFYPEPDNKVLWRMVNEGAIILDLNRDFNYALNKVGTRIWTLFIEGKDVSEIIDKIVSEYKVGKEEVKNDIIIFIDGLKKEGLLSTDNGCVN